MVGLRGDGEEGACGLRGGGTRSEWCGAGRCTPAPLLASRSDHVHRSMKRGSSLGVTMDHAMDASIRFVVHCALFSQGSQQHV